MKDVLEEIVAYKRVEVERFKQTVPPRELYTRVEAVMAEGRPVASLRRALMESETGIISEFKRK